MVISLKSYKISCLELDLVVIWNVCGVLGQVEIYDQCLEKQVKEVV